MGYYFYDHLEQKVFISRNTTFLEKEFLLDRRGVAIELDEVRSDQTIPQMVEANKQRMPTITQPHRRSESVKKQPKRFGFLHEMGQSDIDPKTYEDTMSNIDSGHWLEAKKSEMDSMCSNKV